MMSFTSLTHRLLIVFICILMGSMLMAHMWPGLILTDGTTTIYKTNKITFPSGTLTQGAADKTNGIFGITILSTEIIDTYTELNDIVADVTLTHNGLIDTYSELNTLVADATLTHNGLIDTYSELNTIVADVTLTHNGLIDTYAELNAIVADVTLTHNGLIDTFAELDAIVADVGLLNNTRLDFRAYPSVATQSINAGAWTQVLLATEEFDNDSKFASSTYTPGVAGVYVLGGCVVIDNVGDGKQTAMGIYKNTTIHAQNTKFVGAAGADTNCVTDIVVSDTDDYFTLYAYQNDTGALNVRGNVAHETFFFGYKLD